MTILKPNQINNSLTAKGFKVRQSKHIFYNFYFGEKKTHIFTFMSHGARDIDDYLISKMANQVKLDKNEFVEVIECTIKKDELLQIYIARNELKK